jgi:hypothetical protein
MTTSPNKLSKKKYSKAVPLSIARVNVGGGIDSTYSLLNTTLDRA